MNWLVVTIQWPSGLKLPVLTAKKWPRRTWSSVSGAGISRCDRVWSELTVTSSRPFGEYSASLMSCVCPLSVWRSRPVEASQSCAMLPLVVATPRPPGERTACCAVVWIVLTRLPPSV